VTDFDAHIPYLEGFHKRYIANNRALKTWANTVRQLEIEKIAPQHGAMFPTPDLSRRFIDWAENLSCGTDLLGERFAIPA